MMEKSFTEQLVELRARIALDQKKISLLEQLVALESGKPATSKPKAAPKAAAVPGAEPKKRGRPRKEPSADGVAVAEGDDGKSVKLPALLRTIGQSVNKPITMAELVNLVKDAGYKSDAKDYHNMVYQGIQKLVKTGQFKKTVSPTDAATRAYEWVAAADAA